MENAILDNALDDSFFHDVEDGLIDDYLLGSLAPEERNGFTTYFLSTEERRQRLTFASALIEHARRQPAEQPSEARNVPWHRRLLAAISWKTTTLLAATASIFLAIFAGFQQIQLLQQGRTTSEARDELTRLRAILDSRNSGATQLGGSSAGSTNNPQVGLEHMPAIEFASSTRSVFPPMLRIAAHTEFVRINVKLSPPLTVKYREVLIASNGDQLWMQEFPASILPATKESTIVVPTSILASGNYHLRLERAPSGEHFEQSGDWVFRVEKEL